MNKVQYRNIEGQHKFFALIDYPDDKPSCSESGTCLDPRKRECYCAEYKPQVASIIANAPEILDWKILVDNNQVFCPPDTSHSIYIPNGEALKLLKHNDIFDLPQGYEFKEQRWYNPCIPKGDCQSPTKNGDSIVKKCSDSCKLLSTIVRIVKTKVKPEPEESQKDLWQKIFNSNKEGVIDIKDYFTVQRNKS